MTFLALPWQALIKVLVLQILTLAPLRTLIQLLIIEKLLTKKIGFVERKSAKKNVNGKQLLLHSPRCCQILKSKSKLTLENALRKRKSERKRRKKTLSESVEKNLASQRRKSVAESTLAIAQSPAAATHAAQVAEEMIDRAVDRDDRRRPTRFVPSALCTLTSVMETRSDLVRILEHARALHHLDLLGLSALIAATLTVSVDDRALDLLKRRVAEASKNTEPLE